MDTLPFDAVLCDFDGVVHLWDPDGMNALDRAWGLPEGTLAQAAFEGELLQAAVTGCLSDEQWRDRVAQDLTPVCGSPGRARELVARWSKLTGRVDPDVVDLLGALRTRVPVVLVSNATTRLEAYLAAIGLAEAFDAVVNTARIGVAKPDRRVFDTAARRAGADLTRCLFVDDTAGHVRAAQAAGAAGLHFRGIEQLRAAVAPLLS
ncbi:MULTISPECIES: HAD-IA family hydrolase [unclassified Streptomyces]|uniref:HAD family hydrolase n=1 Tax=unclassified Streptomyces TaxID=2593676 RepID=UPI002474537B|nr:MULTISPECIES: HAD-IA family hydrolase [unclassified Streptomyces]MDH6455948.1 putative hydrolase of the HAD superfamily [Streptomyces sp. SAI-119]MDH6502125.1 putative hydrolase of the HAD superfamily [Streptomyces sp. SAI-149]